MTKSNSISLHDFAQQLDKYQTPKFGSDPIIGGRHHLQFLLGRMVSQTNRQINLGVNYEIILDFIFDFVGCIIPFDRIGIALVNEADDTIRQTWVRSKVPVLHLADKYSTKLSTSSLQEVLTSRKPRIINDLEEYIERHPDSVSTRLILKDGIRSSLTCPLIANNKSVGVVFFSSCQVGSYANAHTEIFLEISEQLSLIIERAKLLNSFEKSEHHERSFSSIIHDLKSPLSVIQGFLEVLMKEIKDERLHLDNERILKILHKNTEFMFNLIEDLSELFHERAQTKELDLQNVDLKKFCMELAELGQLLAGKKNIAFKVSFSRDLPEVVKFDPQKIRRVIENLLSNGAKFSFPNSEIIFRVSMNQEKLIFEVEDRGQGIREEDLPKLFKLYGKTDTLPTDREGSTGLGLYICKVITERHGGSIEVSSTHGVGTKFTVSLPLIQ